MDKYSFLSNADVDSIEEMYQRYLEKSDTLDESWINFFKGFEFASENYASGDGKIDDGEFKVINLIEGYRTRGHLFTKTNPVRVRRTYSPTLDIENYGLTSKDLEKVFQAGNIVGLGPAKLKDIINHLELTYCKSIGIEFRYIRKPERVQWMLDKVELQKYPDLSIEKKKRVLHKLNEASVFEQFLQKKFVGQKRFSIEGAESLIPALDELIEDGAAKGVEEMVVGMAHRGRLNVLANIFNKSYDEIFSEFEGKEYEDDSFDGDVKYHLGISSKVETTSGKQMQLTLSPNPSHLEAVAPVVQGITRSKIDQDLDRDSDKVLPIVIHGDAAIAGQGIVYEVVQMAQLDGYKTGGTLHIVINNQVGFTTNYLDARSSTYCTDVGKATLCPVFHVNGDDVEAVMHTIGLAFEYRQKFKSDVFIDLLCYRKYGHNEGDEPKFTQPKLYKAIAKHPNPREIYLSHLVEQSVITQQEGKELEKEFDDYLQQRLQKSKEIMTAEVSDFLAHKWREYRKARSEDFEESPFTGVDIETLKKLGNKLATLPEGKKYFRKIVKLMKDRSNMIENNNLDWGMGEMLAYATLLAEGHPIRISGQDVERGTFSHRHAVVKTEDTEEEVITLNLLEDNQAEFQIYNSLLSEYGVLGFDYGYAFNTPNGLTIWEAQFGDFNNGAQIMIDQFISAAEDKWNTQNGLVMLLPHGYEGMGSEHSSGRLERFLQLCADYNMQVANCTTPGNMFHLLRRQIKRDFRKPLVVFTPKKLLRYPKAVSKLEDLAEGSFKEVIDDSSVVAKDVDTVVLCSGKIYYDLLEEKEKLGAGSNIAIVRVEQLYPFPGSQIKNIIEKYGKDCKFIWTQEEPENMGGWNYMLSQFRFWNEQGVQLDVASRMASASPASGSPKVSAIRHQKILDKVFSFAAQTVEK